LSNTFIYILVLDLKNGQFFNNKKNSYTLIFN